MVGGALVDEISWNAVFWMHIPVVLLALVGLRIVPESRDSRSLGLDLPGAVLATGGLLALVYGIIQGNEAGWTSPQILIAFGAGIAMLAAFAFVELRARAPMLPLRFFRQRDFNGAVIVIGLIFFAMMVTFFFLTQFFQIVQGKSAFTAGLYILPTAGMMMVGAPISGLLEKSVGPKILVGVAGVAVTFGLLWLSGVDQGTGFGTIAIGLMAFGFGGGMALAPLTDTVMAAVPTNDAGIGSAVNDVSRELGAALGIAIIGSVVSGLYTSGVEDSLTGAVDPALLETAGEGIGVATVAAASLPADVAATVVQAANTAFIDAFTTGLVISAVFMAAATLAAVVLLPWKMRERQAEDTLVLESGPAPVTVDGPLGLPVPAMQKEDAA